MTASYRFGWSGITAAHGRVALDRQHDTETLRGEVATVGLARLLWSLDGTIAGSSSVRGQPREFSQSERYRSRTKRIEIVFERGGFRTWKWRVPGEVRPGTPRRTQLGGVHSLHSALLGIRSLPLNIGERDSLLVTPARTVYLVALEVLGREPVTAAGREWRALKLDIDIRKRTGSGELVPHGKLGRTTAWLSDDRLRLPLRIEADVFIGFVFAELASYQPPRPASRN